MSRMPRKGKFNEKELERLIDGITSNYRKLFGDLVGKTSVSRKNQIWEAILNSVNSVSTVKRTHGNLIKRWYDLRRRVRDKVQKSRRHARGTGGGPPSVDSILTSLQLKVYETIDDGGYEGIGGRDTTQDTSDDGDSADSSEESEPEDPPPHKKTKRSLHGKHASSMSTKPSLHPADYRGPSTSRKHDARGDVQLSGNERTPQSQHEKLQCSTTVRRDGEGSSSQDNPNTHPTPVSKILTWQPNRKTIAKVHTENPIRDHRPEMESTQEDTGLATDDGPMVLEFELVHADNTTVPEVAAECDVEFQGAENQRDREGTHDPFQTPPPRSPIQYTPSPPNTPAYVMPDEGTFSRHMSGVRSTHEYMCTLQTEENVILKDVLGVLKQNHDVCVRQEAKQAKVNEGIMDVLERMSNSLAAINGNLTQHNTAMKEISEGVQRQENAINALASCVLGWIPPKEPSGSTASSSRCSSVTLLEPPHDTSAIPHAEPPPLGEGELAEVIPRKSGRPRKAASDWKK